MNRCLLVVALLLVQLPVWAQDDEDKVRETLRCKYTKDDRKTDVEFEYFINGVELKQASIPTTS